MSESVCQSVSQSALAEFTDVTLVSDDTFRGDEEVFSDGKDIFEGVFSDD